MKVKEVRKKLALLLCAAMVLTAMPASMFEALGATWQSSTWEQDSKKWLTNISMKVEKPTIKVNEETILTVTADKFTYEETVATPGSAVEVLKTLTENFIERSGDGSVAIAETETPGEFTVTGVAAGKVTLRLAAHPEVTCDITVTEDTQEEMKVTGLNFDTSEVNIDLDSNMAQKVKIGLTFSEDVSQPELKQKVLEDFYNNLMLPSGGSCYLVTGIERSDDQNWPYYVEITGTKQGTDTFTITYGKLSSSLNVVVNKASDETIVVVASETPTYYMKVAKEEVEELRQKMGTETLPSDAEAQVSSILSTLTKGGLDFKESNSDVIDVLKAQNPNADTIILRDPGVQIEDMDLALDGSKIIVKSIKVNIDLRVVVDGVYYGADDFKELGAYITMNVRVPDSAARGGAGYVKWTHYNQVFYQENDEWIEKKEEDNSVLEDTVTKISADNIATVRSRSFSPFTLEFVTEDNDSSSGSGSGGSGSSGSSSSGSGGSSATGPVGAGSGQWLLAADGVRWWYSNSDGTWPANGWAQLYWNGQLDWYYFDPEGYMVTGWITDGGLRYYLHPISDGTQGHMYTGWQTIDGKQYYFSEISDGTMGHLLVNTTTPDGSKVGADGARLQ